MKLFHPRRTSRGLTYRCGATRRRPLFETLENRSLLTAIAPADGLVSWWTGDNTTADVLGRNDGALFNGGDYATGKVGDGFNFDGIDDNLQAPTVGFPTGNADRTIELWARIDQQVANEAFFASYGSPGLYNQAYALGTLSDSRLFVSTWGTAVLGPTLQNNRWYHVAATNVGTSFKLYLDGVEVATGSMPVDTPEDSTFWLGRQTMNTVGNSRRLDGMVDEVAVYNRALSGVEIQSIYNAGSDGKTKSSAYFTVDSPSVVEGSSGATAVANITIRRLGDLTGEAIVNWTTADGTAAAGSDYVAASGQVAFQDGQSEQTFPITVNGDDTPESNETIKLVLSTSSPSSSSLLTIRNDDFGVSVSDATATEGDHTAHYRGAFIDVPAGMNFNDLTFGPDGMLYAAPGPSGSGLINKYDGTTGALIGAFVPGGEHISGPRDILFRGNYMYVGSENTDEVIRFDAATGAFVDVFVTAGSVDGPHGLIFGPDSNGDGVSELYVTGRNSFTVTRYDGVTGLPLGAMNTTGAGALAWPENLTVGPGNVLYVASTGTNQVQKYNALSGAYLGAVANAALIGPKGVRFGPDGLMYVTSSGNDRILRFNASGAYVDDYVPAGSGGMDDPYRLEFGPEGDLYVSALGTNRILRFGTASEVVLTVSLSSPSSLSLTVGFGTSDGTAVVDEDYSATTGTLTFAPGVTTKTILIPTVDDAIPEPNQTFTVDLSNAQGAIIVDGSGTATISDNDTKFYVVDDPTTADNRTFEYGSGGPPSTNAGESYNLAGANSAPRGAASTAAGDKVWVVDANKNVYVYGPSGNLLGSWLAGSIVGSPDVQGITTNGTDVWIVDAKSDKVHRYAGAASRLSGSQNAVSSFSLNKSNTNPKDLVTDGTYLWVVDDGTTDKVYKYNLSGSLLASWTVTGAGTSPTGITLDPSLPVGTSDRHLWIVDNGTDRVYQLSNAANLANNITSKAADLLFGLDTSGGNTNPQGIADPPVSLADSAHAPSASAVSHVLVGVTHLPKITKVANTVLPLPASSGTDVPAAKSIALSRAADIASAFSNSSELSTSRPSAATRARCAAADQNFADWYEGLSPTF